MNGKTYRSSRGLYALILLFLVIGGGAQCFAAELRDYTLPSQRRPPYEQNVQQIAPQNRPLSATEPEFNSVYERFRAEIRALTPDQRQILKATMERKLRESTTDEQQMYYRQLIAILGER